MANIAEGSCNPEEANPNSFRENAGQPLPPNLRHELEARMGHDFSKVLVHESHAATHIGAQSNLGAQAYTQGSNIYFKPGGYDPYTQEGQQLISHELVHVVQQQGGLSSQGSADMSMESQADRTADQVSR